MACRTFSTAEVATLFGISADSVRKMEQDGILRRLKVPGIRYSRSEVYAVLREGAETCTVGEVKRLQEAIREKDAEINRLRSTLRTIAEEAKGGIV
ncbi:hypothetical protein [Dialister succinatiphilus]|uniref:hypothetical protein n=1 Tax=Dialister succinatiphilus TaxID=487173 RepID=UPI00402771A3